MKSFFIVLLIILSLNCMIGCCACAGSLMCLPDWLKGSSEDEDEFEDEKKDEVEQSAFISGENPLEPFSTNGGPTGNNR